MKTRKRTLLLAAVSTLASTLAYAQLRSHSVTEDGGSRVTFTSDAPLETINGVTSHVFGEFQVDPTHLASARGTIEVRTGTLRTGIDLRDEHLRSDGWLDSARYPTAKFELTSVAGATTLTPGQETRVTLGGRFTLHGRTRDVRANGRVTWVADATGAGTNQMRIRAHFGVRLTDYGISIPEIVQLKVANEIGVDVSLRAGMH